MSYIYLLLSTCKDSIPGWWRPRRRGTLQFCWLLLTIKFLRISPHLLLQYYYHIVHCLIVLFSPLLWSTSLFPSCQEKSRVGPELSERSKRFCLRITNFSYNSMLKYNTNWILCRKSFIKIPNESNKVTTRWEGPQSLPYHKQWLDKDGLLLIQTCTSKQSYTARVRVDCAV